VEVKTMPTFEYTAVDTKGNEVKAEIEALCGKEAISKIRNKGLYPIKVKTQTEAKKVEVQVAGYDVRRNGANKKVKIKVVTEFARELSTLQDAGLAILRSLRILEEQQKKGSFRQIVGYIADDIEGGCTLSEAMGKHPRCFNKLFVSMVAAGEVGGVLEVILARVADFMEKSERLKSKIKGAMIYPAVVMFVAMMIVIGLMVFVIPSFKMVLGEIGDGKLPALTQALMDISAWLALRYGLNAGMVMISPFILVLLVKQIRRFSAGQYGLDWLKLHLPIAKGIVYRTSVARWTRTLATLISAGVPILEAIKITRETTDNAVYSRMLGKVHAAIRQGDTFTNPLRQSKTVDSLVVNMVNVGEETGDLDKMLMKVADKFDEKADVQVSAMMSLLEPVMIVLLGLIVGTIVLAMFLPIVRIFIEGSSN
jgi:type IV pilus assembly protein PilC